MPALQALLWEPELREIQPFLPSETSEEEMESLPEKKFEIPINLGPIALKNLNKYLTEKGDRTFGIKYKMESKMPQSSKRHNSSTKLMRSC